MRLKKGNSIALFILSIAAIVAMGLLSWFGFGAERKGSAGNIILGLDLKGGVSVTYEIKNEEFTSDEVDDTIYKLQLRVANYSTESEVYKEGENRITVDIPGQYDSKTVIEELGKPGSLMFVTEAESDFKGNDTYPLYTTPDGKKYKVWLQGTDIEDAEGIVTTSQDSKAQEYLVSLKMKPEGKEKFKDATTQNLNKSISILYDDQIISSPIVKTVISNGEATIDNMSSLQEAKNLASTIRIGSLSLELKEISSKVVSAKLGNDAVKTSLMAGLIGLIIVMIFMIIVYRIPGVVSSIALAFYTVLELLMLNAFDVTLTLPGIAGIILSIGMAVDANVIIYARTKEELAIGKTTETAIKVGFNKAVSAILDGNITTLIAALVLGVLGTGPVQGFAITLAMGIVLSMITAMVFSRYMAMLFYHMGFKDKKFYGVQKERKTIHFIEKKAVWFSISFIAIAVSVVFMIVNMVQGKGMFNFSIEFKGGTATTVEFAENISIDDFNDNIKPKLAEVIGTNDIQGQKETDSNRFTIKTPILDDLEKREAFKQVLIKDFKALEDSFEENNISSSVSNEMQRDAIIAVVVATLCMLIYIWFRFKNIHFASSAVLALLHDVLIVLGFYAISRTTVGTAFIACILTIVGYSINATIVIFDRIREKLKEQAGSRKVDVADIINQSITQTLTRSVYTSFTTFVTICALYVLGVEAIREFALPIMVGIIVGGYSSVFITGSLWFAMSKKRYENKAD